MKKRIVCFLLLIVMILSLLPVAGAKGVTKTLTPVTVRQARMWCQSNYNSGDYYYGGLNVTSWGRYIYLRFLKNGINVDTVSKAVIRFEARARETEKEVYMAALSLSDTVSANMETSLSSKTASFVKASNNTSGDKDKKLLTDLTGKYKSETANSVVAYTKAVASDQKTTENTYTNTIQNIKYEYPVTVELDVTKALLSAWKEGNHAQFALLSAKQVYDSTGKQLTETAGNISAHLDTSQTVCGSASYYSPDTKTDDDYFSWMYIVRDTLRLEVTTDAEGEWKSIRENTTDVSDIPGALSNLSYLLSAEDLQMYQKLTDTSAVDEQLFSYIKEKEATSDGFAALFAEAVKKAYWQGYSLRLDADTTFGGYRGLLRLDGDVMPKTAYALLTAFDEHDGKLYTRQIPIRNGRGEYNVISETEAAYFSLCAYAEASLQTAITGSHIIPAGKKQLPGVFITELSNRSTVQFKPNTGSETQGQDITTPLFQFIELHNYSDTDVDLTKLQFIYNDSKTDHAFPWIWDDSSQKTLKAGHTFVIGVYNRYTYAEGLAYSTQTQKNAFWTAFKNFYSVDVPVEDRALIACTKSGTDTAIDGMTELSTNAAASAYIKKTDGTKVTSVSLATASNAATSYSFQFVPTDGGTKEKFLFCTGAFPYAQLKEQQTDYCEPVYFSAADPIKVISYNILANAHDTHTVASRRPVLSEVLKNYQPDIIGMQEVNTDWDDWLISNMPKNYSCVQGISTNNHVYGTVSGTWDLMNPIYYRNDKFKLLTSGYAFLTPDGKQSTKQWDSANMKRSMTWAVLENIKTGERIAHVNAHLVLSGYQARIEQTKLMYQKGAELKAKYDCGIVLTGDHNMAEGSVSYQTYVHSGVVDDSKFMTTNHESLMTCPDYGTYSAAYGVAIDYCMVSPDDYAVQKYDVISESYNGEKLSDHYGLYVELYTRSFLDEEPPVITGVEKGGVYCGTATFTASDAHMASVTLDGTPVDYTKEQRVLTAGAHTVVATDAAGWQTSVTFTVQEHSFEVWDVEEQPTCKKDGKKVSVCTNCKTKQSLPIPATGAHVSDGTSQVITPASCKQTGLANTVCVNCKETFLIELPITDHTPDGGAVTKQPTCVAQGERTVTCTVCHKTLKTEPITPTGIHTPGAWQTVTPATPYKTGSAEQHCTVCKALLATKVLPIIMTKDAAADFVDVGKKDWFYPAVNFAYNEGLFGGISKTKFAPNDNMTRAMFVTVLGRLYGVKVNNDITTKFVDVKKGQWYTGYVKWASDVGIVSGVSPKYFAPDANVTREQICKMMVEYCKFANISLQQVQSPIVFGDADKISGWAKSYVSKCQTAGLVGGSLQKSTGKMLFDPLGFATRAQVAQILYNFSKTYL